MNIRQALSIAWFDLRRVLRRRDTILWLLIMPLPYTYFFGMAFQSGPETATRVTVVAPDADGGSRAVAESLGKAGFDVTTVAAWIPAADGAKKSYRVDLPPALGSMILRGEKNPITVWSRPNDLKAAHIKVAIHGALLDLAARGLAQRTAGNELNPDALAKPLETPPITVESRDWGERREVPSGFKQAVPGNMVMFVLMSVLVTGAIRLLMDREAGHLTRMLAHPVSPVTVVSAQLFSLALVGMAEALYFLTLGRLAFGLSLGPHPAAVVAVMLSFAVAGAGGGVLLGSLLKTPGQAAAVGVLTTLLLAALGGCWWPLEILPAGFRTVALALPTGQAMHALVRLLVWGHSAAAVLPHIGYLAAVAVASWAAGAAVLRRSLRLG